MRVAVKEIASPGSGGRYGPSPQSPDRFSASYAAFGRLVAAAYGVEVFRVSGPDSIWGEKYGGNNYDIVAKLPPGAPRKEVALMLQDLLIKRFALVVHWEQRDVSVYEMVVAKGGLKMKEAERARSGAKDTWDLGRGENLEKEGYRALPPGVTRMVHYAASPGIARISARMTVLTALTVDAEQELGRPVLDKTGLGGAYDFDLSYTPETMQEASSQPGPSFTAALEQQLGLKLVPQKRPYRVVTIDHYNKVPTPN